jgi:hypothetical protein
MHGLEAHLPGSPVRADRLARCGYCNMFRNVPLPLVAYAVPVDATVLLQGSAAAALPATALARDAGEAAHVTLCCRIAANASNLRRAVTCSQQLTSSTSAADSTSASSKTFPGAEESVTSSEIAHLHGLSAAEPRNDSALAH